MEHSTDSKIQVIPVRLFKQSDLQEGKYKMPTGKPIGSWDARNRELWNNFDKSVYLDTPLCIQVVAPKLQEKRLFEAMKVINEALEPLRNAGQIPTAKL